MKVAVIVPAYNIERYLGACLESVLAQTYEELDIVVVDDGSTDSSGEIADEFARRDPRVRVIHKANGGLSDARNAALDTLDATTTPFVTFVDGDDLLHPRFVEVLVIAAFSWSVPIVVAKWEKFTTKPTRVPLVSAEPMFGVKNTPALPRLFPCEAALDEIFYQKRITNSACARLLATQLFDGLRFPVGRLYEDIAIVYDLVKRAGEVAYVNTPLYYYRQRREGSITNHYTSSRYDIVEILDGLFERLADEEPAVLPALRSRRVSAAFNLLQLMPASETARIDHCWRIIKAARGACLLDRRVRLKNKAALLLSLLGKRPTLALLRAVS